MNITSQPGTHHTTADGRRGTAVITGASRGFGAAITQALVQAQWHVIATARTAADLAAAAESAADTGAGSVTAISGDVTDPAHRTALARAAGAAVDLLVNNASALAAPGRGLVALGDTSIEELQHVYATNVFAPVELIRLLVPGLSAAGGVVVNVSSDAALGAYEGWGLYGSSKAALDQVTNVLRVEQPSLRVYALDPGDMRTQMHQDAFPGEDISDRPEPLSVVPALLRLVAERPPSGRYQAADLQGPMSALNGAEVTA